MHLGGNVGHGIVPKVRTGLYGLAETPQTVLWATAMSFQNCVLAGRRLLAHEGGCVTRAVSHAVNISVGSD